MIPIDYPRPNLYRTSWRSLNGWWEFDFYDDYFVFTPEQKIAGPLKQFIRVPFTYQTELSGIGTAEIHEQVVYRTRLRLTEAEREKRVLLHFGAVDFKAEVWIDDSIAGSHEGGYSPFSFDISPFIGGKEEVTLAVVVEDRSSAEQPRGKQAVGAPFECWYTAATGIWQSVWLEFLPDIYIASFSLLQDGRNGSAHYRLNISAPVDDCRIEAEVRFQGASVASLASEGRYPCTEMHLSIPEVHPWSPEEPNIYHVYFSLLTNDLLIDQIETYLAFRDLELKADGLYLHGSKYVQKLVLMQGIWQESGYTAPDAESFDWDINQAKEMGFNGCRMHIKFEDPRFLYAADRLGFLVWAEAPSFYSFTGRACAAFRKELTDIIMRDKAHPSVIVWVIGNESWGMRDIEESPRIRSWLQEMCDLIRSIDPTRPVISNDGWEHLSSDILTVHSYEHEEENLQADWDRARRNEPCGILGRTFKLNGEGMHRVPWVLSEFGAVSYLGGKGRAEHWGYGDVAESKEALLQRFAHLVQRASALDGMSGWCYTQFSDIEKEKNGLLFADRTPKVEPSRVKRIIDRI